MEVLVGLLALTFVLTWLAMRYLRRHPERSPRPPRERPHRGPGGVPPDPGLSRPAGPDAEEGVRGQGVVGPEDRDSPEA